MRMERTLDAWPLSGGVSSQPARDAHHHDILLFMEVIGVVKDGCVILPPTVHLPEGCQVRIILEEENRGCVGPYEREALGEASVLADIEWATGNRFKP